jgi:hypothetical protein
VSFAEETKTICIKNKKILIKLLHLSNAVIILITETPIALGTVCLATPSLDIDTMGRGESLNLIGGKLDIFSRVIAERMASETGKMVLVSVALDERYQEDQDALSNILSQIIEISSSYK